MDTQLGHSLHQRNRDWHGTTVPQRARNQGEERESICQLNVGNKMHRPPSGRDPCLASCGRGLTKGGSKNGVCIKYFAFRGVDRVHELLNSASSPVISLKTLNSSWYCFLGQGPRRLGSKAALISWGSAWPSLACHCRFRSGRVPVVWESSLQYRLPQGPGFWYGRYRHELPTRRR
jgi:hypothetical protein